MNAAQKRFCDEVSAATVRAVEAGVSATDAATLMLSLALTVTDAAGWTREEAQTALARIIELTPLEPADCAGAGRCHGTMSWCERCGDVRTTCDESVCDAHPSRADAEARP